MNDRQQYEEYAQIIDNLIIHGDYEGLRVYLAQIESMIPRQNSDEPAALFYYLGTGYGALAYYLQQFSNSSADADVRKCRKLSLFYMRKAIMLLEQEDQDSLLLLPAYTNYANELDSCGRVIEALRIYRKAINIDPAFGMAIGNYGRALNFYANMVNDNNHRNVLHIYAYQEIKKALKIKGDAMHDDAIKSFYEIVTKYNTFSFNKEILEAPMTFDKYDLGGAEEKRYRIWCLKKHLFLTH